LRFYTREAVSAPGRRSVDLAGGRSCGIFQKAIQRRNVVAAVGAARKLPQLSLGDALDALELTFLIAHKDSNRYPRVAAVCMSHVPTGHWARRSRGRSQNFALDAGRLRPLPGRTAGAGETPP
jgi:hypothetical protein